MEGWFDYKGILMHVRFILTVFLLFLVPLTAQATVAGNVDYLSGEAWIERSGEKVLLNNGDTVDAGDVVVTTLSGRVQLLMQDGSKVFVGRKSRITIDKYETQKGILSSGSFNMLWGKVRFLVAKLSKGASSFSVQTKTATIGVRGTQFAVIANKPLTPKQIVPTTVMLFEGAVVGRSLKGNITNIKPGKLVVFNPAGKITTRNISKKDLKQLNIKPLGFTKTPATSIEPKGKPSAGSKLKAKPVERTKPKAKPKPEAKPIEPVKLDGKRDVRTMPDIKPDSAPTKGGRVGATAPTTGGKSVVSGSSSNSIIKRLQRAVSPEVANITSTPTGGIAGKVPPSTAAGPKQPLKPKVSVPDAAKSAASAAAAKSAADAKAAARAAAAKSAAAAKAAARAAAAKAAAARNAANQSIKLKFSFP